MTKREREDKKRKRKEEKLSPSLRHVLVRDDDDLSSLRQGREQLFSFFFLRKEGRTTPKFRVSLF